MPAPVIVALTDDLIEAARQHLLARDVTVTADDLRDALHAAARYEPATPQPDLFG